MDLLALLGIVNVLIYLGLFFFGIYVVITILKLMEQRNGYLQDIHEELKKCNHKD